MLALVGMAAAAAAVAAGAPIDVVVPTTGAAFSLCLQQTLGRSPVLFPAELVGRIHVPLLVAPESYAAADAYAAAARRFQSVDARIVFTHDAVDSLPAFLGELDLGAVGDGVLVFDECAAPLADDGSGVVAALYSALTRAAPGVVAVAPLLVAWDTTSVFSAGLTFKPVHDSAARHDVVAPFHAMAGYSVADQRLVYRDDLLAVADTVVLIRASTLSAQRDVLLEAPLVYDNTPGMSLLRMFLTATLLGDAPASVAVAPSARVVVHAAPERSAPRYTDDYVDLVADRLMERHRAGYESPVSLRWNMECGMGAVMGFTTEATNILLALDGKLHVTMETGSFYQCESDFVPALPLAAGQTLVRLNSLGKEYSSYSWQSSSSSSGADSDASWADDGISWAEDWSGFQTDSHRFLHLDEFPLPPDEDEDEDAADDADEEATTKQASKHTPGDSDEVDIEQEGNNEVLVIHRDPGRYGWFSPLAPPADSAYSSPYSTSVPEIKPALVIGRSMFETDRIPEDWIENCKTLVDEIWVPSQFNKRTFAAAGIPDEKLVVIPEPIDTFLFDPATAEPLDLPCTSPTAFRFLSVFKWEKRKNWEMLLGAFFEAFSAADDVCLVIRSRQSEDGLAELDEFLAQYEGDAGDRPEIHFIAPVLPLAKLPSLYRAADAFVLPSHGEGWGLPLIEAMAMALPTIATGWSGNTEFMDADNSFLVPVAEMVESSVEGHFWAEPDRAKLVEMMQQVRRDPDAAKAVGKLARQSIVDRFSHERVAEAILARLKALGPVIYDNMRQRLIEHEHDKERAERKRRKRQWGGGRRWEPRQQAEDDMVEVEDEEDMVEDDEGHPADEDYPFERREAGEQDGDDFAPYFFYGGGRQEPEEQQGPSRGDRVRIAIID